jgi:hypothetical protein
MPGEPTEIGHQSVWILKWSSPAIAASGSTPTVVDNSRAKVAHPIAADCGAGLATNESSGDSFESRVKIRHN